MLLTALGLKAFMFVFVKFSVFRFYDSENTYTS